MRVHSGNTPRAAALKWLFVIAATLASTALAIMGTAVGPAAADPVGSTVAIDGYPLDVAVTGDGTTAYVLVSQTIPEPFEQVDSTWVVPIDLTANPATVGPTVGCTGDLGVRVGLSIALAPDEQTLYGSDPLQGICALDLTASPITASYLTTPEANIAGGGMAIRPDDGVLYAAAPNEDNVSAFDLVTSTLDLSIKVDRGPVNLGMTPDGTVLLVANNDAFYVSVIDTQTEQVTATVDVNTRGVGNPGAIAVSNDGTYAYITLTGGYGKKCKGVTGQLAKFNIGTQQVEASIDVGECPTDVAISPDGSRAIVVNTESDTISQIDLASFANVATTTVADGPTAVAFEADGDSAYLASAGAQVLTRLDVPSAPTGLSSSLDADGNVVLDFTPADGNATTITNYAVQVDGQGPVPLDPPQSAPPLTLTGLPTFQQSRVAIAAVNAVGAGALSAPIDVTPQGAPPAPTGLQATAGAGSLVITFTQPAADQAQVTNYAYSLDGGPFVPLDPPQGSSPVTIAGLTPGQSYSVRLAAINAAGTGVGSMPVSGTPWAVPAAPTINSVQPATPTTSVGVQPGDDGGTPVINYAYSLNGGPLLALDPPQTSLPLQIPGLPTEASYELAIAAVNAVGTGAASPTVNPGPPAAPGPPFVSEYGPMSAVTFSATPDALTPITNYQYVVNSQPPVVFDPPQTSSPLQIPDLPAFGFCLTLQAINAFGPGTPSPQSCVSQPPAPTDVTVVQADPAGAVVQFTLDPYTIALTNMRYRINSGTWTDFDPPQAGTVVGPGRLQITMPPQSLSYTFELEAQNAIGSGPTSGSAQVNLPPPAPTEVIALPGDSTASVYVEQADAGSVTPLTNFEYTVDGGTTFTALDPATTMSPFVIAGLTNGQTYNVGVRSVSAGGVSQPTYAVLPVVPGGGPPAPTNLSTTAGNQELTIDFSQPTPPGSAITNYIVTLARQGGSARSYALNPPQATSPVVITGLLNGQEYAVSLTAVNDDGPGPASAPVTGTPRGIPAAPVINTIAPTGSTTEVTFTAGSDGGFPITNYQYSLNGGASVVLDPAQNSSPLLIPDLPSQPGFDLTIAAINSAGAGPASSPVPAEVPSAPTNVFVASLGATSQVTFGQFPGFTPITNYVYSVNGAAPVALSPAQTSSPLSIEGLPTDEEFTLTLYAENGYGRSTASQSITVGVPPAPTIEFKGNSSQGSTVAYQVPGGATQPLLNVEYQVNGGAWVAFDPPNIGENGQVLLPLRPETYQLSMRLVNGSGTGAASAPITMPMPPPPPVISQALFVGSQLWIYFQQPGDAGSPISNYQVLSPPSNVWIDVAPPSTSSPLIIDTSGWPVGFPATIRAVSSGGPSVASNTFTPLTGLTYQPIDPIRVLDTRSPTGGGALQPSQPRAISLGSVPGLPPNTVAVAFNATATGQTSSGFLAITPDPPQVVPPISTVNWTGPQQTVANAFVSKIGSGQMLYATLGGNGSSEAVVDVLGYFVAEADQPQGAGYTSIVPQRVYDSRTPDAGGPLDGGQTRVIALAPAVPPGAVGAEVNITITGTRGTGFLTVRPEDTAQSTPTSLINWSTPNTTLASGALVALGPDLEIHVRAGGTGRTDIVVDVRGYFLPNAAGALFYAMTPERQYDSRAPGSGGPISAGQSRTNSVVRVPDEAVAAAVNLTITGTQRSGYLELRGPDQPSVLSSVINWTADNQTRANGTNTTLTQREFLTSTQQLPGSTQYLVDVAGFYLAPPG